MPEQGPPEDAQSHLTERFDGVHLDTTMALTDFSNAIAAPPPHYPRRPAELRDKVVLGLDLPSIP